MTRLVIVVFILTLPFCLWGQNKLYPKNEVYKDSSLTDFICKLQYAIFKKDKNFLLSVVDKNVKNSFGGDDGIEEFKQMWQLDSSNSSVWFYLSKLISMGGTFSSYKTDTISPTSFVFPYVFNMDLPSDTLDFFWIMAVTATNVNVREKPEKNSKLLGQLSYDIVTVDDEKSHPPFHGKKLQNATYYVEKEWYYVTTLDKKLSGYVYWEYLWSPIDYRLFLDKINGQWKITCLIAGD
jgi:hypothetical protein